MNTTEVWQRPHRKDRLKFIREESEKRKAAWDKLSTREKLKSLDDRLGKGVGATKQRKKLLQKLKEEKQTKALEKEAKAKKEKKNKS